MSVFKCKMCGGTIEFEQGATVGVCDCCGTKQTLPKTSDDAIANLFNRANNLRLKCEFDKAAALYEKIVEQDDSEAEAHWGLVLCKYGIEYVDDPATGKKIPTCHRTLFEAVTADADYQAAIDYSDVAQQVIYETEARTIDRIQKDILAIVKNEKPFDVFICYKETDENGKRTQDSAIANDIYYQLTQEGFKVFYAAITLEDKLGQEYEPYIFAALNSAKVMLVVGTNPMYFNAVWVRNEWSRYLKLMKTDRTKLLIPCYRDMDAYELPEEFAHLQAQDMSKIGFINDVVRGIKKVIAKDETSVVSSAMPERQATMSNNDVTPLLRRVFLFLEDGKWEDANTYCEKVLDIAPENAEAYLGKMMAELQVKNRSALANAEEPIEENENYQKVMRFGDEKIQAEVKEYNETVKERIENERLEGNYSSALKAMNVANSEATFKSAAGMLKTIFGYKDADSLAEKCIEKAEICKQKAEIQRKEIIYAEGKKLINKASYYNAIQKFQTISGYKDADELMVSCKQKIEELKERQEKERKEAKRKADEARAAAKLRAKKIKKILAIVAGALVALIAAIIVVTKVIVEVKLNNAQKLIEAGNYESAYAVLEEIGKDEEIATSKYERAMSMITLGEYNSAYALLEEIGKDEEIAANKYERAIGLMTAGDYESAYLLLKNLDHKDSDEKLNEILSIKPNLKNKYLNVGDTVTFGNLKWIVLEINETKALLITKDIVTTMAYNDTYTAVTWETCTLRTWLNSTFLTTYVPSSTDSAKIITTTVVNDDNSDCGTEGGNTTYDKVFLLSIAEAKAYFSSYSDRVAYYNGSSSWWWLRSPGNYSSSAANVSYYGNVFTSYGNTVDSYSGVRPALWVNLGS